MQRLQRPIVLLFRQNVPHTTINYRNLATGSTHLPMDAVPEKIEITTHNQYVSSTPLTPSSVLPNPLDQFRLWFTSAQSNPQIPEPEAISLATSTPSGVPSVRFVLLKRVDARGFVFFTNYTSRKAQEIESNSHAAMAIYWGAVHRQVRVVGKVERVEKVESEEYYNTRPIGSRVGAWASPQSQVVAEDEVAQKVKEIEEKFSVRGDDGQLKSDVQVPLPEFWGGYRIVPE